MELLLDLQGCDPALMTEAKCREFFIALCDRIRMKRVGEPLFWQNESGDPCLHGPSAYRQRGGARPHRAELRPDPRHGQPLDRRPHQCRSRRRRHSIASPIVVNPSSETRTLVRT
jgi:hypothetical protein